MATWQLIVDQVPSLAEVVKARFDVHRHKTLATLRTDGSPRISGIEADFRDGELWLGGMYRSLKCLDLIRDPRFALHSGTFDAQDERQPKDALDVKLAGRAIEVTDDATLASFAKNAPPGPFHLFRADITELVLLRIGEPADHIVVESWHEGRGVTSVEVR